MSPFVADAGIDAMLNEAVEKGSLPCLVAITADRQGISYSGAYGPVTADSIFWVQSMVKAITTTACMQLVERGCLDLDLEVGGILSPLKNPLVIDGFGEDGEAILRPSRRPILLRHLLTHTSGFTDEAWSSVRFNHEITNGHVLEYGENNWPTNMRLEFDPGARWQYGHSLGWVCKLVEAVSGEGFYDFIKLHILDPLDMANTGFIPTSEQLARIAPAGTRLADGTYEQRHFALSTRPDFHRGNGDLFTTPNDYIVFLQMLLHEGMYKDVQILRAETVRKMRQNHIGILNVQRMISSQSEHVNDVDMYPHMDHKWGLSFDLNPEAGPNGRSAGSFAWGGGPNVYYWVDPAAGIASVFMTQLRPFFDAQTLRLLGAYEQAVYARRD